MTPIVGVSFIMRECEDFVGVSVFVLPVSGTLIVINYSVVCEEVHSVPDDCACR